MVWHLLQKGSSNDRVENPGGVGGHLVMRPCQDVRSARVSNLSEYMVAGQLNLDRLVDAFERLPPQKLRHLFLFYKEPWETRLRYKPGRPRAKFVAIYRIHTPRG